MLLRSARKSFPRRDNLRGSNERKSREEYDEITDLSPTFDRPREEVPGKSSAPDMLRWSVVTADKLATSRVVSL